MAFFKWRVELLPLNTYFRYLQIPSLFSVNQRFNEPMEGKELIISSCLSWRQTHKQRKWPEMYISCLKRKNSKFVDHLVPGVSFGNSSVFSPVEGPWPRQTLLRRFVWAESMTILEIGWYVGDASCKMYLVKASELWASKGDILQQRV